MEHLIASTVLVYNLVEIRKELTKIYINAIYRVFDFGQNKTFFDEYFDF